MKKTSIPVLLVAVLYIFAGVIGFIYHIKDFSNSASTHSDSALILLIRILAVIIGILLLMRIAWSRWLAVAWLLYHVILSAFHSTPELITHIVLLLSVTLLLFLPVSNMYFRNPAE